MIEPGSSEEFSLALVNALLLALWPVLPALLLGYARQASAARQLRPEFSLRKSEILELDRAVRLYEKVSQRLKILEGRSDASHRFWHGLFRCQPRIDGDDDELEDLRVHARHLRETIVRLKRRPLQRLRSWVHLISSKSALGRGLAAYIGGFVLLLLVLHGSDQPAWADGLTTEARLALAWYPFDERFFYVNAVATGFAAAAAPLFYLARWLGLRWEYGCEYCAFKEFARSDPGQPIDPMEADEANGDSGSSADTIEICADIAWSAVLDLSSSATIEEVKEAYKRLVKQNHPDRVHGMSPAFRKLAEAETKRLNAAFKQALVAVSRTGIATN